MCPLNLSKVVGAEPEKVGLAQVVVSLYKPFGLWQELTVGGAGMRSQDVDIFYESKAEPRELWEINDDVVTYKGLSTKARNSRCLQTSPEVIVDSLQKLRAISVKPLDALKHSYFKLRNRTYDYDKNSSGNGPNSPLSFAVSFTVVCVCVLFDILQQRRRSAESFPALQSAVPTKACWMNITHSYTSRGERSPGQKVNL
eukprot:3363405-Amphidinium_carterae.1